MRKRAFLIFMAVIGCLVAVIVSFIQSESFAQMLKRAAARHVPGDLGIEADFTDLKVKLFPPGLSIRNPKILLRKDNVAHLPPGSRIEVDRVDLVFSTFQAFSGNIRVQRVVIAGGEMSLSFDRDWLAGSRARSGQKQGLRIRWDELLQVHADSVALENTRVKFALEDPGIELDLLASDLRLSQWNGPGGLGYDLTVDLRDVKSRLPKEWAVPTEIKSFKASLRGNAAGIDVQELQVAGDALGLDLSGRLTGNVMSPGNLLAQARVKADADLSRFRKDLGGKLHFEGKASSNPSRLLETLRAEGQVTLEKASYQGWTADRIEAQGDWNASPSGGELKVNRWVATEERSDRVGGSRPGRGGRIEAGPFRWKLGASEPVSLPLTLQGAHVHWLAGPLVDKLWPLDARGDGRAELTIDPGAAKRPWSIAGKVSLQIPRVQLDNQRRGRDKPLHRVIDVKEVRLDGGWIVDAQGFRPQGLALNLPHSRAMITGQVDPSKSWNLKADAQMDLSDIGQLSQNEIRGKGAVVARVRGVAPDLALDFDTDIKEAYYLKMKLGDFRGRVTWEDRSDRILLSGLQLRRGQTDYTGQGIVALGEHESVAIDVEVPQGDIQDFTRIFEDLTADLWWFPRRLKGGMDGKIRVSGGLGLDQLVVQGSLNGTQWDYMGERFRTVVLSGGLDHGRYHVDGFRATKRKGSLAARVSYDAQKKIDWDFKSDSLSVSDLDNFARLDIPFRGDIQLSSHGSGRGDRIESMSEGRLTDASIRGEGVPPSEVFIKTGAGSMVVQGAAFGGQGSIDASYDFNPGGSSYLRAHLRSLDFTPMLLLLNPKLIQDRELRGSVSGLVDLTFRSGQIELGSGRVELSQYLLAKTGTRFELVRPVSARIDRGAFDLQDLKIAGRQGEATFSLHGHEATLEGKMGGSLDASLLEFVTGSIARAEGLIQLDGEIRGEAKGPEVYGKAKLDHVTVRLESIESPIEGLTGTAELRQNVLSLDKIEGELAGGRVTGGGSVSLFADRYPTLDLSAYLLGNRIKMFPFQFAKVKGKMHVHGDAAPYVIDGDLNIESALSRERILNQQSGQGLKSARFMPIASSRREGDLPLFKLNIHAVADRGIIIQNDLFVDSELKCDVTVVNTPETPRILGTAEMIQGRLSFKDRVFQVQSANVNFDNPAVLNPLFSLAATTEVNGTKIQVYASGRAPDKFRIELSTNPPMPEHEILNLLALGVTSDEVQRMSAGDRSLFERGEAASLLLHTLDFNRDVQSKTGFEIQLDETTLSKGVGNSITRPRTDADSSSAPKIVVKRRLGEKIDLTYGGTVGVGSTTQQEVNAEVRVTPGFSVIGVWDYTDSVATPKQSSFGVDFKLQKRFK